VAEVFEDEKEILDAGKPGGGKKGKRDARSSNITVEERGKKKGAVPVSFVGLDEPQGKRLRVWMPRRGGEEKRRQTPSGIMTEKGKQPSARPREPV